MVDEHGASVPQTATITITGTNDAPTVNAAISQTLTEDSAPLSIDLLQYASDVDNGAVLSIANLVQTSGRSIFPILSGSQMLFDPVFFQDLDDGQSEDIVFTYDVIDEHGASVSTSITITVTGTNDAPVASNITVITDEDAPPLSVDLLSTASDVDTNDQGSLQVLNLVQTAGRSVTPVLVGSQLSVDSSQFQDLALGESEDIVFSYEITDGDATITNTVTITVEGRNDTPVVNNDLSLQISTVANTFSFAVPAGTITDIDTSDVLTWSSTMADGTSLPSWLSFDPATQTFSGTPAATDRGLIRIVVTATDPHGASASVQYWLAISDDVVYGTPDRDVISLTNSQTSTIVYGLEDNDELSLGDGSDIYIFRAGDGFDTVDDNGWQDSDIVLFEDYNLSDASFSYWGRDEDDLLISFANGDSVLVRNTLNGSNSDQIEQIAFADGTVLSMNDIRQMLMAEQNQQTNARLTGFGASADTLEAGLGDDFMSGRDGSDIYIFNQGDGSDIIEDIGWQDTDVLQINGYSSFDASFSLVFGTNDDLSIRFANGDTIIIRNTLTGSNSNEIEQITFSGDGVTYTMLDIRTLILTQQSTNGDDTIFGFSVANNETLEGGLGDDFMSGRDGSDTYIFNAGDGQDVIEDNGWRDTDVLDIRGYAQSDASFSRLFGDNDDLRITFANGDSILIRNTLLGSDSNQIEEIRFDGGTGGVASILTMSDLRDLFISQMQTNGNDVVDGLGGNFDQTFEAGLGNDFISGGDGSDTYIFNVGDGQDVIEDNGWRDTDVLEIRGYTQSDATFTIVPGTTSDLMISFASGDRIILKNSLNGDNSDAIEQVRFVDNLGNITSSLTMNDILAMSPQPSGDGATNGTNAADTLEALGGDDYIFGLNGSDTYIFRNGHGHDVIEDNGGGDTDIIEIHDFTLADTVFERVAGSPNDILISFSNGETIHVRNTLSESYSDGSEEIRFVDAGGTVTNVFTMADLRTQFLLEQSTAGNDTIIGFDVSDSLSGGLGNDELIGGNGSDSYNYAFGDGQDIIRDNGSFDTDIIYISGVLFSDVIVSRHIGTPADLTLTFSDGGSITIIDTLDEDYYNGIEQIVFVDDGGLTMSMADFRAIIFSQESTAFDDRLIGISTNDILTAGLGNDFISGGNGSDTYIFNAGDGRDIIQDGGSGDNDVLSFADYNSSDAIFSRLSINSNDLVIDFANGDQVIVINALSNDYADNIEQYVFADGTTILSSDLAARIAADAASLADQAIVEGMPVVMDVLINKTTPTQQSNDANLDKILTNVVVSDNSLSGDLDNVLDTDNGDNPYADMQDILCSGLTADIDSFEPEQVDSFIHDWIMDWIV